MADVQSQFIAFHTNIQLENLDENKTLREKRDILLEKLRKGLEKKFEDEDDAKPKFRSRNLGSYAMGTGIKPIGDRDYDIDVGLFFQFSADKYKPVEVKEWVCDILNVHPHTADIRRPCVTVYYHKKGEVCYHVDFAVLSDGACNDDGTTKLAKGFSGSKSALKVWEDDDPEGLITAFKDRFSDHDRLQYRRVIRYLKRWKDEQFSASGEGAPRGIGLNCAAYRWFRPNHYWALLQQKRVFNDLQALRDLVDSMLVNFVEVTWQDEQCRRLRTPLPVCPWDDPFERMSNRQMTRFETKLEALRDALAEAADEADPVEACEILRDQFGDDFPVPPKEKTGKRSDSSSIIGSGHYG